MRHEFAGICTEGATDCSPGVPNANGVGLPGVATKHDSALKGHRNTLRANLDVTRFHRTDLRTTRQTDDDSFSCEWWRCRSRNTDLCDKRSASMISMLFVRIRVFTGYGSGSVPELIAAHTSGRS